MMTNDDDDEEERRGDAIVQPNKPRRAGLPITKREPKEGEERGHDRNLRRMRNRTGIPSRKNGHSSSSSTHEDGAEDSNAPRQQPPPPPPMPHPRTAGPPRPHRRRPQPKNKKLNNAIQDWDDEIAHLVESSIVTPRTMRASVILAFAMAVALLFNAWEHKYRSKGVDPTTSRFLADFCEESDASCHPRIHPHRRTQRSMATVSRGETITTIPRRLLILDVDALMDPYLQQQWAGQMTNVLEPHERMDAAAFLAVHVARLLKGRQRHIQANSTNSSSPPTTTLLERYMDVLASASVVKHHPLLLSETFVERQLRHTSSFDVWKKQMAALSREYEILATIASPDFVASMSWEEYRAARLLVMTRAFGTGPPPTTLGSSTAEAHVGDVQHRHESTSLHLRTLESQFQVDLSSGSYAMVPVLDFYDHRATPNVGFEFKLHSHSHHRNVDDNRLYGNGYFHITALETIAPHTTLYDSYGLRTDSDLFARYGFVQGDGTDYTQTSVAVHPLDFRPHARRPRDFVVRQRGQILRYLQYDDGHIACVHPTDASDAYELKRLKYLYLLRRADHIPSWTVVMHPRQSHPTGRRDLDEDREVVEYQLPPPYDPSHPPKVANGTSAYTTCRVISLLHTDYDGRAKELLSNLANDTTRNSLPSLRQTTDTNTALSSSSSSSSWEDALEYRTLHCMARMVAAALQRLNTTVEAETLVLRQQQSENQHRTSWDWHFAQLRWGEVVSLMHLRDVVRGQLKSRHKRERSDNVPGYVVRRSACPRETLDPLFKRYGTTNL